MSHSRCLEIIRHDLRATHNEGENVYSSAALCWAVYVFSHSASPFRNCLKPKHANVSRGTFCRHTRQERTIFHVNDTDIGIWCVRDRVVFLSAERTHVLRRYRSLVRTHFRFFPSFLLWVFVVVVVVTNMCSAINEENLRDGKLYSNR